MSHVTAGDGNSTSSYLHKIITCRLTCCSVTIMLHIDMIAKMTASNILALASHTMRDPSEVRIFARHQNRNIYSFVISIDKAAKMEGSQNLQQGGMTRRKTEWWGKFRSVTKSIVVTAKDCQSSLKRNIYKSEMFLFRTNQKPTSWRGRKKWMGFS